jgi:hypothetical protein
MRFASSLRSDLEHSSSSAVALTTAHIEILLLLTQWLESDNLHSKTLHFWISHCWNMLFAAAQALGKQCVKAADMSEVVAAADAAAPAAAEDGPKSGTLADDGRIASLLQSCSC